MEPMSTDCQIDPRFRSRSGRFPAPLRSKTCGSRVGEELISAYRRVAWKRPHWTPLGSLRGGFFAKTSSASRQRNSRSLLVQSHGALQARKKVVRGAPVWFRLSIRTQFYGPEGLPKRGTVTERNVGGPPRAIRSPPRAKLHVNYGGLCAALQF